MGSATENLAKYLYDNHVLGCKESVYYKNFVWPEWKDLDEEIKRVWDKKAIKVLCGEK